MSTFIEMPLYNDDVFRYNMSLEGQNYYFTFYWNARSKGWQMDLKQEDQTPLVLGYQLVAQYPMMEDYTLEDFGLTGHFVLLPINSTITGKLTEGPNMLAEFYSLFYVYNPEA